MTDPAERLAEAARNVRRDSEPSATGHVRPEWHYSIAGLFDALAAFDAAAPRRAAEQAVIEAAKARVDHLPPGVTNMHDLALRAAVRALRDIEEGS